MIRNVIMELEEYWVIRVIKDTGNLKQVVKEIPLPSEPSKEEIAQVLLNCDRDCFISVEHNYRLVNGKMEVR